MGHRKKNAMEREEGKEGRREGREKGDKAKWEGMREFAVGVEYNHNALYASITLSSFIKLTQHREKQI